MDAPNKTLVDRVSGVLGWTPASWTEIKGGYTAAVRYVVRIADTSAFVKVATTPLTAAMLRREIRAYGVLSGAACCPRLIGWQDDDQNPLLVIEDLSGAYWPPPLERRPRRSGPRRHRRHACSERRSTRLCSCSWWPGALLENGSRRSDTVPVTRSGR